MPQIEPSFRSQEITLKPLEPTYIPRAIYNDPITEYNLRSEGLSGRMPVFEDLYLYYPTDFYMNKHSGAVINEPFIFE
jgi:hypothetical protein